MFIGEYSHTIDAKGRLIVPKDFRSKLGNEFVVTAGLDGCLSVYTKSEWKIFEEKLHALPISSKSARKFSRFFLSNACSCELDKQGRILLPQNLRELASLTKDVVFAGVGGRVEIWNKAAWQEISTFDNMDEIAESMEDLGI